MPLQVACFGVLSPPVLSPPVLSPPVLSSPSTYSASPSSSTQPCHPYARGRGRITVCITVCITVISPVVVNPPIYCHLSSGLR
eukprot:5447517-Pyramimonas_sp.AAC.1